MRRFTWTVFIAVLVVVSGCQTTLPVATGTHTICDTGDFPSPHLPRGAKLTINPLGANLRPTEVDFPDGSKVVLATVSKTALVGAATLGSEQHFIRIRPDPDFRRNYPNSACKSDNVHLIEMCFKERDAWRCADDGRGHYGHAHSEPDG